MGNHNHMSSFTKGFAKICEICSDFNYTDTIGFAHTVITSFEFPMKRTN